jgi:hypothetical protein
VAAFGLRTAYAAFWVVAQYSISAMAGVPRALLARITLRALPRCVLCVSLPSLSFSRRLCLYFSLPSFSPDPASAGGAQTPLRKIGILIRHLLLLLSRSFSLPHSLFFVCVPACVFVGYCVCMTRTEEIRYTTSAARDTPTNS